MPIGWSSTPSSKRSRPAGQCRSPLPTAARRCGWPMRRWNRPPPAGAFGSDHARHRHWHHRHGLHGQGPCAGLSRGLGHLSGRAEAGPGDRRRQQSRGRPEGPSPTWLQARDRGLARAGRKTPPSRSSPSPPPISSIARWRWRRLPPASMSIAKNPSRPMPRMPAP